jgi:hypothetical protein
MKNLVFIVIILVAAMFVSCEKENEILIEDNINFSYFVSDTEMYEVEIKRNGGFYYDAKINFISKFNNKNYFGFAVNRQTKDFLYVFL